MKKIFSLIIALIMIVSLYGCTKTNDTNTETKDAQTKATITPLLYKISDDKGNHIWLFGSIHIGLESFYPLPQYVTDAYESSDALAVEFDIVSFSEDLQAQTDALTQLVYMDGTTIKDHIPDELYKKSVEILEENNMYSSALDYYYPVLWESFIQNTMLEQTEADSDLGIDMHFLNLAHEDDKKIIDIESAEFQYGMMAKFSESLQILLLEEIISEYEDINSFSNELDDLITLWSEGDEKEFAEFLNSDDDSVMTDEEKKLLEEYNQAMLTDRNISMSEFAQDCLKDGEEVFICVGAAHIVGEGAMADLLAEKGYTVEIIK